MFKIGLLNRDYFGKGEIEAFLGLFGDVFSKIAVIIGILFYLEGFPVEIVMGKILPGIAMGSVAGGIIYYLEAYKLNKREGRTDATALPFGIGAMQVFAWLFIIIVPVYRHTGDANLAWQVGLAACFWGGVVEVLGALFCGTIKKYIPNSALFGNMVSSAILWLAFNSFVLAFEVPVVSVFPLFLLIIAYKFNKNLIPRIPNALLVVFSGCFISWCIGYSNTVKLKEAATFFGFYSPKLYIVDIVAGTKSILPYLSVIIPLQIANFITTMQSVEAAGIVGDRYRLKNSMLLDSCTTFITSIFGSPFPTTVYYGHAGWKRIGARSYYSLMMCIPYLACFAGIPLIILAVIPYEVVIVFLFLVGIAVGTEVVDGMGKEFSAIAFISLMPLFAQYIHNMMNDVLAVAGTSISQLGIDKISDYGIPINGILILSYGGFASSLMFAAWAAYVYEKNFRLASIVSYTLAFMSFIGFIHCESIRLLPPAGVKMGLIYIMVGFVCLYVSRLQIKSGDAGKTGALRD